MGHNVSERKLRELDAVQRSRLAAGWVVEKDGRVTQPQTPAAVRSRGAVLIARCTKREDCYRRVTFDPELWCARGLGLTPLAEVLAAYRCAVLPCRLDWLPERFPAGSPVGAHLHDEAAKIVVTCPCGAMRPRTFTLRRFAELTAHAGPARLAVPAEHLPPSLIRGACSWCRERRWRFRLIT